MRRAFDFQDDDEIETESYCLSNSSHTQSLHSEGLSRSSSKKNERNSSNIHLTKTNSSDGIRKNDGRLDRLFYTFQQQQLVTLAGIIIIVILLITVIIGILLYSKVKFGSSRKGETELSSALSPKLGISGSCSDKIKRAIEGFSGNCGSMSSSLPLILSSRYNVYESFVSVQSNVIHGSHSSH